MNALIFWQRMVVRPVALLLLLASAASAFAQAPATDAEGSVVLSGHSGAVIGVAAHPDGKQVLSASDDGTVRAWDVTTGKEVLKVSVTKPGGFFCVAVSPDGKLFAAGSTVGEINVYEFPSGKVLHQFDGKGKQIQGLAFGIDNQCLFSGSVDKSVMRWNLMPGKQPQEMQLGQQAVTAVAVTLTGKEVLDAGGNGVIRAVTVETGKWMIEWRGPRGPIYGLAVSPDGKYVAAACDDKTVRVRYLPGRQNDGETHVLQGHTDKVMSVAYAPGGKHLVSGGFDKKLILWDLQTSKPVKEWAAHQQSQYGVRSVAVDPKGTFIASGGYDSKVRIWKLDLPAPTTAPKAPGGMIAGGMTITPFEMKDPPEHLQHAVRLTPVLKDPKEGSNSDFQIHFEKCGALFLAVKQLTPETKPNLWGMQLDQIYGRQGWISIGECPWKEGARLWIKPTFDLVVMPITIPQGLKVGPPDEPVAELDLIAVGHEAYLDPKYNEEFGWRYVEAISSRKAAALFRSRRWKDLENYFEFARKGHPRFPNGNSFVEALYNGVMSQQGVTPDQYNELYEAWEKEDPNSAIPRLIKVKNVSDRVWKMRGGGFADTVSNDAIAAMKDMTDRCLPLLREAAKASPDDSYVDLLQLSVVMGKSASAADVRKIAESGLKKDPWDVNLLRSAGNFLMPRWTGEAKAFSTLATKLKKDHAATSGPSLYAVAALTMFEMEPEEWDTTRGFDYKQMLEGLKHLHQEFPEDIGFHCTAVRAAVHKNDLKTARELFDQLEGRHVLYPWDKQGTFIEWYDFFNPPTESPIRWQRPLLKEAGNAIGFTPDGKKLLLATLWGKLYELDAATGKSGTAPRLGGLIEPMGVAGIGKGSVQVLAKDRVLSFKDGKTNKGSPLAADLKAGALSANGRIGAGLDQQLTGVILNGQTGKALFQIPNVVTQNKGNLLSTMPDVHLKVKVSADGKRVAFVGQTSDVGVYDSATGKPIRTLNYDDSVVEAIAFHSNGTRLIAAGRKTLEKKPGLLPKSEPAMWEWDVDTGEVLWAVASPSYQVRRLAASSDGERIALALDYMYEFPYETNLWITKRNQAVAKKDFVREQRHKIADLQWSPDGNQLAVLGQGGFLRMYGFEEKP